MISKLWTAELDTDMSFQNRKKSNVRFSKFIDMCVFRMYYMRLMSILCYAWIYEKYEVRIYWCMTKIYKRKAPIEIQLRKGDTYYVLCICSNCSCIFFNSYASYFSTEVD